MDLTDIIKSATPLCPSWAKKVLLALAILLSMFYALDKLALLAKIEQEYANLSLHQDDLISSATSALTTRKPRPLGREIREYDQYVDRTGKRIGKNIQSAEDVAKPYGLPSPTAPASAFDAGDQLFKALSKADRRYSPTTTTAP